MSTLPVLRPGSRDSLVAELRRLLNAKLRPSPSLPAIGSYDAAVTTAVRRFQQQHWLIVDGTVGPCTWNALKDWETYVVECSVRLVAQPTSNTCWAAAAAMVLGRASPVSAPPGVDTSNGLPNDSSLNDYPTVRRYAQHLGLRLEAPQSWTPLGLANLMRGGGPLLMHILWNAAGYTTRNPTGGGYIGSPGHFAVMSGIRGDGDPARTTVRIHDPWPVGRGAVYSVVYSGMMARVPTATYHLLHR